MKYVRPSREEIDRISTQEEIAFATSSPESGGARKEDGF
jgi:hypothetical protein